jgi:hypothetical protein
MIPAAYRSFAFFAITAAFAGLALADEAARISRLESEIQQLRTQIDEQSRRIQRLEAELARRGGTLPASPPPKRYLDEQRANRPAALSPQPWHSSAAWDRVAKGMKTEEVLAVLGEPTAVESVDALKTLFFRGTTPAGAAVNGLVNLRDERVVAVVKPDF